MKVALEQPVRVGDVAVAAVAETRLTCRESPRGLTARSLKRPLAVLVHRVGVTRAYTVEGQEISADAFDARFPGQRAAFEQRLAAQAP